MDQQLKIILVEDDSKKIEDITSFMTKRLPKSILTVRESYQSGVREILNNSFDVLLLDMSIPTYDKTPFEVGGPYEKFGGYKILKELSRKNRPLKTILITMFDDFGESDQSITLEQINSSLSEDFPSHFLGSVFYQSKETKWQEELYPLLLNVNK